MNDPDDASAPTMSSASTVGPASEIDARPVIDSATASAPRGPRPTISTVVGALFVAWAWMIGIAPIADNSFLTHLATGRLLVDGSFPRDDVYSFTARGEPWIIQSWLASVVYGVLDSSFGVVGIRVLGGALAAAVGAMVWALTRPSRTLLGRIVCACFPLAIGTAMWAPRPLMFGLVFLGLTMLCLEGRLKPGWLLPAYWVWANTHGSFPLGLVAIGSLAVGVRLDGTRKPTTELRALAWAAGGSVAAVIGPLGPKVLIFPIELLGKSDVLKHVVEWQSPDFNTAYARLFLAQVGLSIVLLVRRPKYRAAIPLVVFTCAALFGLRNIPLASIVLTPGLARSLRDVGSVTGKEAGVVARVGLAAVVLVASLLGWRSLSGPDFDLASFPVQALAWMDETGMRAPGTNIVTSDVVGNYLEAVEGEDARVFLDDRFDMYPRDVIDDYLTLSSGQPGWGAVLDRRDIDSVLWERSAPLVQLLGADAEWHVAYQDATWAVVCRRGTPGCAA